MLKRPLLSVAIAFAVGILLSGVFGLPMPIAITALGFGCACAVAWRKHALALLFLIAAIGFIRYDAHITVAPDDVSRFIPAYASEVSGRIASDVDMREDRAMFTLIVRSVTVKGRRIPASGRLMVVQYKPENDPTWQPPSYGDVLYIRSRISRPSTASNPGAFSWRDYLARQRIHAVTYVRSPEQVSRIRREASNLLMVLALIAKEKLATSIREVMPEDEASVVIGMDLGTYTALPDRLMTNFTRTGTLHLLAASGFNCAVIVFVFGFVFLKLLKWRRSYVHVALILILVFYMMIVGAKPSIVRATIMASLLLLGAILNRPADAFNLLFAAVLIILAVNPADLFDVGFQLSLAAVLALILVLPVIQAVADRWKSEPDGKQLRASIGSRAAMFMMREGWQGLIATVAATLGTLPLSAHYFNQLSLVSFPVNAIVAATVLPIFIIGLLLPLLSPVPLIGGILAFIGTVITKFALATINWFGELPYSSLSVPSPGAAGVIGYYAILTAVILYVRSKTSEKKRTPAS